MPTEASPVSGLHAEVEVFGHGELADSNLDRTLQLLFGLLVGNGRAERVVYVSV